MTSTWELVFGLWLLNPAVTFGEVAQGQVRKFTPRAANPLRMCTLEGTRSDLLVFGDTGAEVCGRPSLPKVREQAGRGAHGGGDERHACPHRLLCVGARSRLRRPAGGAARGGHEAPAGGAPRGGHEAP
eukprot:1100293-Prorocentrum_minimum.AAC.1